MFEITIKTPKTANKRGTIDTNGNLNSPILLIFNVEIKIVIAMPSQTAIKMKKIANPLFSIEEIFLSNFASSSFVNSRTVSCCFTSCASCFELSVWVVFIFWLLSKNTEPQYSQVSVFGFKLAPHWEHINFFIHYLLNFILPHKKQI